MRRHTFVRSTFVLITALAFAACGDDGDDCEGPTCPGGGDDLGSLSATVSGDVSDSFSGEGFFAMDEDEDTWGIYMGGTDEDDSAVWFWGNGGQPGTGTHTLTLEGETGGWYVNGETGDFYYAESGTLTITTSNGNRVAGSFDFTASDLGEGEVTVEGTFSAPNWTDEIQ